MQKKARERDEGKAGAHPGQMSKCLVHSQILTEAGEGCSPGSNRQVFRCSPGSDEQVFTPGF